MAEYIEREKVIKAVTNNPYNVAFKTIKTIEEIKSIPTADVVPVVRCKDCKHYTNIDIYRNPPRMNFHWCNKLGNITNENDYCSYGERRCD